MPTVTMLQVLIYQLQRIKIVHLGILIFEKCRLISILNIDLSPFPTRSITEIKKKIQARRSLMFAPIIHYGTYN